MALWPIDNCVLCMYDDDDYDGDGDGGKCDEGKWNFYVIFISFHF